MNPLVRNVDARDARVPIHARDRVVLLHIARRLGPASLSFDTTDPEFAREYTSPKQFQIQCLPDDMIDLADSLANDWIEREARCPS